MAGAAQDTAEEVVETAAGGTADTLSEAADAISIFTGELPSACNSDDFQRIRFRAAAWWRQPAAQDTADETAVVTAAGGGSPNFQWSCRWCSSGD